ncbi:RPM1-interacting protein 4-like [Bidens hawaiensis]|uniref:RPM1-interacting protein 4-like n=1 Tax=Bidens hawaiensis TaxID=980011 RepID=UPI0040496346
MTQVPKFGDWDNQGDDVPYTVYFEKAKKTRKSKMNPQTSDKPLQAAQIKYGESEPKALQTSPRSKLETRVSREEADSRKSSDSSSQQPRGVSRPSGGSFDNSPRHHPRGGNRGSVSSESSYGAGSSTPSRTKLGQVTRGDENGDDRPAIPKFGDWDDSDPTSGEGYTELFNKARHGGGGKSPMITSEDNKFYGQRNKKSKGFGCFSWIRK